MAKLAKNTHLGVHPWFEDKVGVVDKTDINNKNRDAVTSRKFITRQGQMIQMMGRLHIDLFQQRKISHSIV